MPSREAFPLAEAAARRALQIDSTLGFAHALVAEATASFHRRWAAAEPLFRRALELDPDDPEPHQMFGVYLGPSDTSTKPRPRCVGPSRWIH